MWKYVTGDNYNLDDLYDIQDFFLKDLGSAIASVSKGESYKKYGLPNWHGEMVHRYMGLEEAKANLDIVKKAIREAKNGH